MSSGNDSDPVKVEQNIFGFIEAMRRRQNMIIVQNRTAAVMDIAYLKLLSGNQI